MPDIAGPATPQDLRRLWVPRNGAIPPSLLIPSGIAPVPPSLTSISAQSSIYEYLQIRMPQQLANFKAEFFKALAHPLRIGILDSLRGGEKGVNELSEKLRVEPANVSQQLAVLRFRNIVMGRKAGSSVFYSVADPALFKLLDVAREIFNNQLVGVREMLEEIQEGRRRK